MGLGANAASDKVNLNFWGGYNEDNIPCGDLTAQFTHFAVTYDGTYVRLYANGVEVKVKAVPLNVIDAPLRVGGRSGGNDGQYLDGIVDEVKIYKKTLSAAEVSSLYSQGMVAGAPASLDVRGDLTVGSTEVPANLAVSGAGRFDGGITHVASLGDIDMGEFDNEEPTE